MPKVLISDFGECAVLAEINNRTTGKLNRTGCTGTLEFMAPELLLKENNGGEYYYNHSKNSDIWSLGIILYYLSYSTVPYSQIEDLDVLRGEMIGFEL